MLAVTTAVNGAGMISWLFPCRLVELGLPGGPVLSYTAALIACTAIPVALPRLTAGKGQAGERVSGDEDEAAEDRAIL
jgi:hypothetical protein